MVMELVPGALIGGRYRLDALLGEGGMGAVWAATHQVTRQRFALKMLKARSSQRQDHRRRFWREARAASAVQHPNVVRINDLFELEDQTLVMVMDLLTGQTLGELLHTKRQLSLEETASYLVPAVSAVGTAHALGIVHRDLKPDNIYLVETRGPPEVRVLDFGIAKLTGAEDLAAMAETITNTGAMLGTPYYMSPEQGLGERDVDHRTDIWALGVILFEALAGARPVEGENLGQVLKRLMSDAIMPLEAIVPDLPADVAALARSMLSRDRNRRPEDLREVQAVLERHTTVRAPAFGPPFSEPGDSEERPVPEPVKVVIDPSGADSEGATARANVRADTEDPTTSSIPPRRRSMRLALWAGVALTLTSALAAWRLLVPAAKNTTAPENAVSAVHEGAPLVASTVSPPAASVALPSTSAQPTVSVKAPHPISSSRRPLPGAKAKQTATASASATVQESAKSRPNPHQDGLVDDPPF
jgi:eukaryotic-like serine/threonine-protein kinase